MILNLSIWFALHTLFRETVPVHAFPLDFDMPVLKSIDVATLVLSIAAATAIFRFKFGMLTVLAGSAGAVLRAGGILIVLLSYLDDLRDLPAPVDDRRRSVLRPVHPQHQDEVALRGRQPVGFFVCARRLVLEVEGQ